MKEIGGYFELECGYNSLYHTNAILLNSARNALRYIIRAYHIQTLYAPYYTCPVVWQAIQEEKCQIIPYDIGIDFMPTQKFKTSDFILYNNYFGVCDQNVQVLAKLYPNLIIDSAQAFYSPKAGLASFYSPRKFFGLPDGGIALCDQKIELNLEQDTSYSLCSHLLKRWDLGATAGYSDFQKNDNALIGRDIKQMSRLTEALMGNIDYEYVRKKRLENFQFLHNHLGKINRLMFDLSTNEVPMVYPFFTDNTNLRQKLIQNKIYVATYWPEIEKVCLADSFELYLQSHLLPLPIDQRYNVDDMMHIIQILKG